MQVFPEKKCSRIGRETREFSAFSKTGKSGENSWKKRAGDKNPRPLKTGRGIEISGGGEKNKIFAAREEKEKRKSFKAVFCFRAGKGEKPKESSSAFGRIVGKIEKVISRHAQVDVFQFLGDGARPARRRFYGILRLL